jgi:hypothetical protein
MKYDIRHITKDEVMHGLADRSHCCISDVLNDESKCDMWPSLFASVGSIGLLTILDEYIIGRLLYLPKEAAKRIGMPRGWHSEPKESTMVIMLQMG